MAPATFARAAASRSEFLAAPAFGKPMRVKAIENRCGPVPDFTKTRASAELPARLSRKKKSGLHSA
jgi:hypothetical protein